MAGQPTSLNAPANRGLQQAEGEGDEPGEAGGEAFPPFVEFTISAAMSTMLSAIAASTGGPGTSTKPKVAAESVMLCARVKAVTVSAMRFQPREDERQDEEQMIDAEKDMLDAQPEIGGCDLATGPRARGPRMRGLRA